MSRAAIAGPAAALALALVAGLGPPAQAAEEARAHWAVSTTDARARGTAI